MSLSDRIAGTLEAPCPKSIEVSSLIADAEGDLSEAVKARKDARAKALDPTTPDSLVSAARGELFELEFRIERLIVALDRLREKHDQAVAREEEERRKAEIDEVVRERDALATELKDRYPTLAGELADLLGRIKANSERVAKVRGGVEPVEAVVRGMRPPDITS